MRIIPVGRRAFFSRAAAAGPTVFELIAQGRHDTLVERETPRAVGFRDIAPYGPSHFVVAPRVADCELSCITLLDAENEEHRALLREMLSLARELLRAEQHAESEWIIGFEVMTAFHQVQHLHLHAIAPASALKWGGYFRFDPGAAVPFRDAAAVEEQFAL